MNSEIPFIPVFRTILACLLPLAAPPVMADDTVVVALYQEPSATTVASTFSPEQAAANLTNGSGLHGAKHDRDGGARTMWHSAEHPSPTPPAAGLPPAPAWVRFEFPAPVAVDEVRIWNHNQAGLTDRGFRETRIYGSADGGTWSPLASIELKASGDLPQTIAISPPSPLKAVLIAAQSNHGGSCYGLSEVKFATHRRMAADTAPFPTAIECRPAKVYRHRPDGKAGREVTVIFGGTPLYHGGEVEIEVAGVARETTPFTALPDGRGELRVLLPAGVAVGREAQVSVRVRAGHRSLRTSVLVPPQRQWKIHIVPHSHVDIGYTNTQENCEHIHRTCLLEAIKLAAETAGFPPESRYKWDTEVAWPVERLLANGSEEEKSLVLDAIRKGIIYVGASYSHNNTSVVADEEFAAVFAPSRRIEQLTGRKSDTLTQVDIPGMSWGTVAAAARHGVPYVFSFNNGSDRVGHSMEASFRPFWWLGPDGVSKVLYLQPGSYAPCAQIKGHKFWPAVMGQFDRSKIPARIRTDDPRRDFIDEYLWGRYKMLEKLENDPLYPYDILPMGWALADNMPIDADLPYAAKSWNEEYAYPKVILSTTSEIMREFDRRYGAVIPVRSGEFTEYWTDGLGSAARQTAMNRASKERLIQAGTLWAMLRGGEPAPRETISEAWRNILLGSEHTWCYSNPSDESRQRPIKEVKFGYFQKGEDLSKEALAEALAPVVDPGGEYVTVFNTLSWARGGLVTLPPGITALENRPVQELSDGSRVFFDGVAPFGASSFRTATEGPQAGGDAVKVSPTTLDNGLLRVTLHPDTGDISSIVVGGREFVDGRANTYHYLKGGNAPDTASGPSDVKLTIKERGPLVASLVAESAAEGCRWLKREVRLVVGQPYVEIINTLDKVATTGKEGIHFGFAFRITSPRARMDIPWGVADVDGDFFPEANRNWICFQRWLEITGDDGGVVWTSPDAPTFQYGAITANILGGATNSPAWLRKVSPSAKVYSWALNNHWHTNFPLSQEGVLTFRYHILPRLGAKGDAAAANRLGTEQARPLIAVTTAREVHLDPPVTIENPSVAITSVESVADGWRVSLRSLSGQPENVVLKRPTASAPAATATLPPFGNATVTVIK